VEEIVGSFRFLDDPPTEGLSWYRNEADGYELLVPDDWPMREEDLAPAGVQMFGQAVDHAYPALSVSLGTSDGSVEVCRSFRCTTVDADSLAELDQVLQAAAPPLPWEEEHRDATLGGHRARIETFRSRGTVWADPAFHYVYTVRGGQPVILAFDYWTIRLGRISSAMLEEIIASFRFLDPAGSTVVTFPAEGFELTVPYLWRGRESTTRPNVVKAEGPGFGTAELLVSSGDPSGRVQTCLRSAGAWESCRLVTAHSLAELEEAVPFLRERTEVPAPAPAGHMGRQPITLDGEPATQIQVLDTEEPAAGPELIRYVVALHDGRPFVLRFHSSSGTPPAWIGELLEGFRFLD
jgi:hypothetical protein